MTAYWLQEIQQERVRLQTDEPSEDDSLQASTVKQKVSEAPILIVAQEVSMSPCLPRCCPILLLGVQPADTCCERCLLGACPMQVPSFWDDGRITARTVCNSMPGTVAIEVAVCQLGQGVQTLGLDVGCDVTVGCRRAPACS